MSTPYVPFNPGTIQVTNGTKDIVGTGTNFTVYDEFDTIWVDGYPVLIDTITDATHATAVFNYLGTTGSGKAYEWVPLSDLSRSLSYLTQLQSNFDSGNLSSIGELELVNNQSIYATGPGVFAAYSLLASGRSAAGLAVDADDIIYYTDADTAAKFNAPASARNLLTAGGVTRTDIVNVSIVPSVGSSALTVALKIKDGTTDASAALPAIISVGSNTATNGSFADRSITGALSLVVPSTATLGQSNGVAAPLYVYAIDNAGTIELAISGDDAGSSGIVSTTILNTASDSATVMYSTTARASVAFRRIAVLSSTQSVAGTWATVPTQAATGEAETALFKSLKDDATTAIMKATLGVLVGTTTNDSASAGQIGEYLETSIVSGSAVSLTTNVVANVATLALTAGDWDVWGLVALTPAASTSITIFRHSISLVSATLDPATPGRYQNDIRTAYVPGSGLFTPVIGPTRISLAAPATIYLVAQDAFTVSTLAAYGYLRARRVR